jgi:hypothetical protein
VGVIKVFVSYRREDSAPYAGRICDQLGTAFGSERVFMDVEDIVPGSDAIAAIDNTLSACNVLVAVIGPRWIELLRAKAGARDYVSYEIAAALGRGVTVIPVLVGGSNLPKTGELNPEMSALADRQAMAIRDVSFRQDVNELVRAIRHATGADRASRMRRAIVLAAGVLLASGFGLPFAWRRWKERVLTGDWEATMQASRQKPYKIRLHLVTSGRTLSGSVEYPTGTGRIDGGTFQSGRIAFFTKHVPHFATEEATILFSGELREGELDLTLTTKDSTVARGIAKRVH